MKISDLSSIDSMDEDAVVKEIAPAVTGSTRYVVLDFCYQWSILTVYDNGAMTHEPIADKAALGWPQ